MIMGEWDTKTIGDLGRVVTGKTPPTENLEYFEGDHPFVSPKDLERNSFYISDTQTRITEKALEKFKNQVLPKNAVMFTSLSFAFGKMGITSRPSLTNQQINSIVVNDDHNFKFVYYLLRAYEPIIFSYNSGIDTPIVPKSVFEKIQIRVPKRREQKKIAAILSAYDDLIENNQRRIALLEKMAEEIYREWFVRFRFPGHEQVELNKGIPQGWLLKKLDDAFDFTGGGTPSKEMDRYWQDGVINWYTPTDITAAKGIFLEESGNKCTEEGFNNSSAKMFPSYSIMMTSRATIGAHGMNLTPACTNQGFITCIPNEQYPLTYLYHWLKLSKPHFELLSGGSTFPELIKGTFKRIEILTPPKELVQAYDQKAAPIFQMIEKLITANRKLEKSRDSLLPRLISGKLKVEKLDIQFPPSMLAEA